MDTPGKIIDGKRGSDETINGSISATLVLITTQTNMDKKFVHNLRPNTTKNHTLHASKAFKMGHSPLDVIKLLQYEMAGKNQVHYNENYS